MELSLCDKSGRSSIMQGMSLPPWATCRGLRSNHSSTEASPSDRASQIRSELIIERLQQSKDQKKFRQHFSRKGERDGFDTFCHSPFRSISIRIGGGTFYDS